MVATTSYALVASPATADHSNPRRWSGTPANVVVVDRTGDPAWHVATQHAVKVWNEAGSNLRLSWTSGTGACGYEDHTINVCMGYAEGSQALAWYQWGADGYLTGAKVIFDTEKTANVSSATRNALACHEVGHNLVLDHTYDTTSCMSSPIYVGTPNAHDYESLQAKNGVWSGSTTSTTVAPTTTTTSTTVAPTTTTTAPVVTTTTTAPSTTTTTTAPTRCRPRRCR